MSEVQESESAIRTWSTRTLVVAAVAAVALGVGAGVALGAAGGDGSSGRGGPGGMPGQMRGQFPGQSQVPGQSQLPGQGFGRQGGQSDRQPPGGLQQLPGSDGTSTDDGRSSTT